MKLCLIMIGRFEERNGSYFTDKKNINAIMRYMKYFDEICVVARQTENTQSLYPRQKVDCMEGKISFYLYKEIRRKHSVLAHILEFKKVIKQVIEKCDFVLSWAEPKTNTVVKVAKKLSKPVVIYVGGCNRDSLLSKKSIFSKLVAWPIYISNRRAIRNADYVHYVTNDELQKRYPTNGKSLSASYVNINLNDNNNDINFKTKKFSGVQETIKIGLIGYLNQVKGIDTAIKALARLDDRYILKILGGGNPKKYLTLVNKLNLKDRVFFEGTLEPGIPVLQWLDDIDLYIQPSRTEGLPRATIEAMSRGCPIITSNAMGLKELVNKKWSHKAEDWKKLSSLIKEMSSSIDLLREESKRSFIESRKYNRSTLDNKIDVFFSLILKDLKKYE
jgi:glycosyltransferase involved in cell wall biosynthesis